MINFIKKKFFWILSILNFHQHIYKPEFNTTFPDLYSQNDLNFDLLSDFKIDDNNYTESCLITCVDRKDNFLKSNNFIFESWVYKDKKTYTNNYNFSESHKRKIFKNLRNKKFRYYNKKIFIFPYYSNQFGHFVGENLGGILFFLDFLKKRNKKEKLLIIPPSKKWESYFKKNYKENCLFFSNKFFLKNNIVFANSQIFPKFSVYQNYVVAKNILSSKIENYEYKEKKVFLTSERVEKIVNIKELVSFLKDKNFLILNPKNMNIEKLYKILNSAKIVISEFASISHNIHIARNKPYYLLMSKDDKKKNLKWYRLTHFYKNFHAGLFKPIYFDRIGKKEPIPYQSQIKVDLKKIKKILN